MSERDNERIRVYQSLFEHPGWDLLVREFLDSDIESLPERVFANANNWDDVLAGRAAYAKLVEIRAIPEFIQHQVEQAAQEAASGETNLEGGSYNG